jgi:glycosyltransferase involved in cell wall biosynthesis
LAQIQLTPKFTVIIPTRDRPDFLNQSVASVLNQNEADLELLIVNDGEPLQTSFSDARVRVLDNHKRGAVHARNLGVETAKGEIIAFLDDDDIWIDQNHLAKSATALAQRPGFYFANGVMAFPDGTVRDFSHKATAATLKKDNTILISAVCYTKSLHEALGRFDESIPYYWDWDWYLRVARSGAPLHHQTTPAVSIRVHANNMSGTANAAPRQENLDHLCVKHRLQKIVLKSHIDFV